MKQRILRQTRIRSRRPAEVSAARPSQRGSREQLEVRRPARTRKAPRVSAIDADDSLGLYLHEMGLTPLLSREEELALVRRLEVVRRRYRQALLWDWSV